MSWFVPLTTLPNKSPRVQIAFRYCVDGAVHDLMSLGTAVPTFFGFRLHLVNTDASHLVVAVCLYGTARIYTG